MKATIRYKKYRAKTWQSCTVDTDVAEPNAIIRIADKKNSLGKNTHISTIRCNGKIYMWNGSVSEAY